MEETRQATTILLVGLPLHILYCYYFVFVLNYGVVGLAFAINLTYGSFLVMITLYCSFTRNEKIREAWVVPDAETLEGWGSVLELGIPGVFVYFIDFGSFEAIALFSGMIGIIELSTMGILLIVNQIFTCGAYGMQFTSTIFIGKSIGANNTQKAQEYAKAGFTLVYIFQVLVVVFALTTRNTLCRLFTTDPGVLARYPTDITYCAIFMIIDPA
jgi:Na+-driven multidrug efflux pump